MFVELGFAWPLEWIWRRKGLSVRGFDRRAKSLNTGPPEEEGRPLTSQPLGFEDLRGEGYWV